LAGEAAEVIRLDDFLKRTGWVGTGGEAKLRIQSGEVRVNSQIETRRRRQLVIGDVIEIAGERYRVGASFTRDQL
jgi:ribosome-associated protein